MADGNPTAQTGYKHPGRQASAHLHFELNSISNNEDEMVLAVSEADKQATCVAGSRAAPSITAEREEEERESL